MKRKFGNFIMIAAVALICLLLLPTEAKAASVDLDYLYFTLNDDGNSYTLTGCHPTATGDLTIPATYNGKPVTTIAKKAFSSCSHLTSITIPDSVITIEKNALYNYFCPSIIYVDENNPNYSSDSYGVLFNKDKTELIRALGTISGSYTIPDSVTTIDEDAFYNCDSLTSVTIPGSVTTISVESFYSCGNLTSVTIGSGVTTIADKAFYACSKLTNITIPDSVTFIGNEAFYDCTSLNYHTYDKGKYLGNTNNPYVALMDFSSTDITKFQIPSSTRVIYERAFYGCNRLTSVTIPHSVVYIGDSAFYYCWRLTSVTIPDSVTAIGNAAFTRCESLTGIWVDANNPNYSSDSFGVLFDKNKTELIQAPGAISGDYIVPDGVTTIVESAFYECNDLTGVTLPDSVTTIGDYTFHSCYYLSSVTIGNSVTTIGYAAFYDCPNLASVSIGNGVTSISDFAFYACSKLTNITIPDSVTSIGASAFSNCSKLTSVTIGNGVTSIGDYAFGSCSDLTDVYYTGTQAQWDAIAIGFKNEYLLSATLHLVDPCADGHTEEIIPGKAATCTESGLMDGKKCTVCGETTVAQDEISALGHTEEIIPGYAATCTVTGLTEGKKCSVCSEIITAQEEISALGHTEETVAGYAATCTKTGLTDGKKCTVCGEIFKEQEVISALGHTEETIPGYAATCTEPGLTDGKKCSVCAVVLAEQEEIPATGHIFDNTEDTTCNNCAYARLTASAVTLGTYNKLLVTDNEPTNNHHRAVVYYLGEQSVADITDEAALKAIDANAKTHWGLPSINKVQFKENGNYVVHVHYNEGTGVKQTVAKAFTVNIVKPAIEMNGHKVVVTAGDSGCINYRATVYYLGEKTADNITDEAALKANATSAKTYWGLNDINKVQLLNNGNYVILLHYNIGTSAKQTIAKAVTRDLDEVTLDIVDGTLTAADPSGSYLYHRAVVYYLGEETSIENAITTKTYWTLNTINKVQLTKPGNYVILLHYNLADSAKLTTTLQVTI